MSYSAWSVIFGEVPSAAKWNILGSNDASFNDGTGIGTDAVRSSSLYYGLIRNRQGGSTGDATWASSGTSNTATDAKDVFVQAGSIAVAANPTTVTFPTAFNQVPLVIAGTGSANSANVMTIVLTVSATQFTCRQVNDGGTATTTEIAYWAALGQ